jgi:AcrR family transcriptional regulator
MGIVERKYRQKEEVRSLILDTAWRQILEEGCHSLSIRKVADAIEYSVPVIYSHFESKDAILKVFVQRGFGLLAEELLRAKEQHTRPSRQLEAMSQAYWDFSCTNKEYYQLMFGLGIPSCDAVRQVPEIQAFSELIQSVIQQAIAVSKHPEASYILKFHTYWSILHGMISIQMNGTSPHSEEMSLQILTDAIGGFIFALQE